jgi:hypothetical protein
MVTTTNTTSSRTCFTYTAHQHTSAHKECSRAGGEAAPPHMHEHCKISYFHICLLGVGHCRRLSASSVTIQIRPFNISPHLSLTGEAICTEACEMIITRVGKRSLYSRPIRLSHTRMRACILVLIIWARTSLSHHEGMSLWHHVWSLDHACVPSPDGPWADGGQTGFTVRLTLEKG